MVPPLPPSSERGYSPLPPHSQAFPEEPAPEKEASAASLAGEQKKLSIWSPCTKHIQ